MKILRKISCLLALTLIFFVAKGQKITYTINICIDSALKNNLQFRSAKLDVKSNQITLNQSYWNRLPNLSANVGQSAGNGRSYNVINGDTRTTNYTTDASINSSVTLYNGYKIKNTVKQNFAILQSARFDEDATRNTIINDVINAYLQVLLSYDKVNIAEEQVRTSDAQVNQTKNLLNVGKVAETSLFQIQSQNASDKLTLVSNQNDLLINKINLFQLMDVPVNDSAEFERVNIDSLLLIYNVKDSLSRQEIYATALDIMPEVKSSYQNTKGALYGLKVTKADRYPKLTLSGNISTTYSTRNKLRVQNDAGEFVESNYPFADQFSDNLYKGLSLNLSIPIFNNYLTSSRIQQQEINIEYAQINEQNTKNILRKEIEQAYAQYVSARNQYLSATEQMNYAGKSYESVNNRYKLGIVDPTELQIEKNNYLQAEIALSEAKYQLLFAIKIMEYYQKGELKF